MEQTIAAGQDEIIDEIADMYSGLSQDMNDIKGYITQSVTRPGTNQTYSDFVNGLNNDLSSDMQDLSEYEEQINAYIDNASLGVLYTSIGTQLIEYGRGFLFWGDFIDDLTEWAPAARLYIYGGIIVTILSMITGIGFGRAFFTEHDHRVSAKNNVKVIELLIEIVCDEIALLIAAVCSSIVCLRFSSRAAISSDVSPTPKSFT